MPTTTISPMSSAVLSPPEPVVDEAAPGAVDGKVDGASVGRPGGSVARASGVAGFDGAEAGPVPAALVAVTVNV